MEENLTLDQIKGLTDRQLQEVNAYYNMRQTITLDKIYKNVQFWFWLPIALGSLSLLAALFIHK